jgi:hypothetical protein
MDKTQVKRGRGRPRKDYSSEVGKVYFNLKILSVIDGPTAKDGVMVQAQCLACPKMSVLRLRDARRGHSKTCRCGQVAQYKKYCDRKASACNPGKVATIWTMRRESSREQVIERLRMEPGVVDACIRRYQKELEILAEGKEGQKLYRMAQRPGVGYDGAAKAFGLGLTAARYVIDRFQTNARKQAMETRKRIEWALKVASRAARVQEDIETREPNWPPPFKSRAFGREGEKYHVPYARRIRKNEFSSKEFRASKGEVEGQYARLYLACLSARSAAIDDTYVRDLDNFISLADNTLRARAERGAEGRARHGAPSPKKKRLDDAASTESDDSLLSAGLNHATIISILEEQTVPSEESPAFAE